MKALTLSIFAAFALSLAVLGAASAAGSTSGAKVGTARTDLGRLIVDGRGRTLYLFERDKHGRSACSGACAAVWMPLVTHGKPVAIHGAKQSLLGVVRRADGRRQVKYAGHPMYRYIGDTMRGQTNGEGSQEFGAGCWDALTPSGKKIESGGDEW
jgi:predicted lipoprotein with Yx(FWY)xxD motif